MKNKLMKVVGTAIFVVGLSATVQAIPITGSVDMNGTAFLNSANLGTASAVSSIVGSTVGGIPTGSFAGSSGSVVWSGFSWPSAVTVSPLWTYTSAGETYSFSLENVSVISQSSTFLNLSGWGVLTATGAVNYDPTGGTWAFTISNSSGGDHANFAFTFANSQTAVPDGGATLMLLGTALSAVGLLRKKFIA